MFEEKKTEVDGIVLLPDFKAVRFRVSRRTKHPKRKQTMLEVRLEGGNLTVRALDGGLVVKPGASNTITVVATELFDEDGV